MLVHQRVIWLWLIRSCIHFTKHGPSTIVAVSFQLLRRGTSHGFFSDFCIGIKKAPESPNLWPFFRCILGRIPMVGKRIMAADVSRGHPGLIRASLRDRWSSCLQWIEMQHPDGFFFWCRKLRFHTCRCWSYLMMCTPSSPDLRPDISFFYQNMPSGHFKKSCLAPKT